MFLNWWGKQDLVAQSAAELRDIVRDGGELIIVDNSEVAHSLVECGFEITETCEGDDGTTEVVLQVRGENHVDDTSQVATPHHALPAALQAMGTVELSEDRDPATFRRGPVSQNVAQPSKLWLHFFPLAPRCHC